MARRGRRAILLALALASAVSSSSVTRVARAQVRWDASAQAGPIKRWLADRPPGGDDAGFGGEARLAAHVALLPLVRAGGYAAFDVTGAGDATRLLFGGGLHAKLFAPIPSRTTRLWLATGFGLVGAYSPSYETVLAGTTPATVQTVQAARAGGRFFEVPVGVGAGWKVWGPWSLTGELGVRLGFAHGGSLYDAPGRAAGAAGAVPPAGADRVAVGLLLGVLYDP